MVPVWATAAIAWVPVPGFPEELQVGASPGTPESKAAAASEKGRARRVLALVLALAPVLGKGSPASWVEAFEADRGLA